MHMEQKRSAGRCFCSSVAALDGCSFGFIFWHSFVATGSCYEASITASRICILTEAKRLPCCVHAWDSNTFPCCS